MTTSTIAIPVPDEVARAYASATEQDRRKLGLILALSLRSYLEGPRRSLDEIMQTMGEQAVARRLTEETLDALLREPGDG